MGTRSLQPKKARLILPPNPSKVLAVPACSKLWLRITVMRGEPFTRYVFRMPSMFCTYFREIHKGNRDTDKGD